jgi:hypothetical protein
MRRLLRRLAGPVTIGELPRARWVGRVRCPSEHPDALASTDGKAPLDLRFRASGTASARSGPRDPDPAPRPREPALGHRRIVGELAKLGISISETSVRNVLKAHGVAPAPRRSGASWRAFVRQQAASMIATMLAACACKNSRQLGPQCLGAGPRPARASKRQTVLGETEMPSLLSSPEMR